MADPTHVNHHVSLQILGGIAIFTVELLVRRSELMFMYYADFCVSGRSGCEIWNIRD